MEYSAADCGGFCFFHDPFDLDTVFKAWRWCNKHRKMAFYAL